MQLYMTRKTHQTFTKFDKKDVLLNLKSKTVILVIGKLETPAVDLSRLNDAVKKLSC